MVRQAGLPQAEHLQISSTFPRSGLAYVRNPAIVNALPFNNQKLNRGECGEAHRGAGPAGTGCTGRPRRGGSAVRGSATRPARGVSGRTANILLPVVTAAATTSLAPGDLRTAASRRHHCPDGAGSAEFPQPQKNERALVFCESTKHLSTSMFGKATVQEKPTSGTKASVEEHTEARGQPGQDAIGQAS
jgi:hypothetical protein